MFLNKFTSNQKIQKNGDHKNHKYNKLLTGTQLSPLKLTKYIGIQLLTNQINYERKDKYEDKIV